MTLKPIGTVKNKIGQSDQRQREEVVSEIVMDSRLTEALEGLGEFSHIIVLYWMHRVSEDERPLKVHPMRRQELPLTGVFATRAQSRPNRIGITTVRLLERDGNTLRVKGLDAVDGSPVVDIKPYIPTADLVADNKVPQWITNR